jgi:acyl-CoA thioesterase-1
LGTEAMERFLISCVHSRCIMSDADAVGWIIFALYAIFIVVGGIFIFSPPANNPRSFLRQKEIACPGRKRVVLAGDSITHGHVGADYSAMLKRRLKKAGKVVDVINAGINSQLAWNVVQNVDDIVACNPDYVTILIGTNDVHSTLDPMNERSYMKQWKLPQVPDATWYRKNLEEAIGTLKDLTKAKVAVLSLPTIGEDPDDPAFKAGQSYSMIAKEVATKAGVAYLPICETMVERIKERPSPLRYDAKRQALMQIGQLLMHYHGIPYGWISRAFKLRFHVDFLHLNPSGAAMVADLVEKFVLGDSETHTAVLPRKIKRSGFLTRQIPAALRIDATTMLIPKHIDPEGLRMGFLMGMITMEGFKAICHLDEAMTLAAFSKKIGWDDAKSVEILRHLLEQDLISIV